ncbi:phosphotransferase enzyme family protein [Fusarium bulbicola]|nr:phosphotransferase enzyme family protein [Fusarium bulbicola]
MVASPNSDIEFQAHLEYSLKLLSDNLPFSAKDIGQTNIGRVQYDVDFPFNHITALLDYDFSSIQHPAYEFFRSSGNYGGSFTGWSADPDAAALRSAKLTSPSPSLLPTPKANANAPGFDWEVALT